MTNEIVFKVILIGLYSIFTIIRITFSRFSRKNTEVDIKESKFRLTFLQFYIASTVIIFFLYIFFDQWFSWGQIQNYPEFISWIGFGLGLLSLGMFTWIHIFLNKNFSYTLKIFENHKLITKGPYKFIRHPMYTAFLIFHSSIFLITGNWFIGIIWIVGLLFIFLIRIRNEEKMLIETFGEVYREYIRTAGILFPSIIKIIRKHKTNRMKEKQKMNRIN
ncbi:MAG: isoprenylcysteine carboxylmethyltransferase family protein [Asgard group archaeon]|nr:isoprenylcysteine carboxylmethyltransferase family protein [Asgard group archaeon]